jgi:hypothetical protein
MRWAGHAARMGETINGYKHWSHNVKGRKDLRDIDLDERLM